MKMWMTEGWTLRRLRALCWWGLDVNQDDYRVFIECHCLEEENYATFFGTTSQYCTVLIMALLSLDPQLFILVCSWTCWTILMDCKLVELRKWPHWFRMGYTTWPSIFEDAVFLSILPFPRIERLCQVSWIQGAIDSRYYESDCSGYGGCSGSYSRLAVPEHDTWCPTGTSPLLDTANTLQVSALKPHRVDAIFLLVGWGVNMPFTTNKQVMITTPNRLHFYQKKPLGIDASVQHRSYGSKPRCRDPVSPSHRRRNHRVLHNIQCERL